MNQNFILLDACSYIQSEGRGFFCHKNLQMNELRLFASSIGFLNGAASTHLSMNVIPSDVIDILYSEGTARGTFNYVNRLRMCIVKDNDERIKQVEKETAVKKKPSKEEKEKGLYNLWGQATKTKKEQDDQKKFILQLHPSFKTQLERIVSVSPRIESFGIKWRNWRTDDVCRKVNDAFATLQDLAFLRHLHVGLTTFDYCHFVEHLPHGLENLSLSSTFNSRYRPPKNDDGDSDDSDSLLRKSRGRRTNRRTRTSRGRRNNNSDDDVEAAQRPTFTKFLEKINTKLPQLRTLKMIDSNINGEAVFSPLANHPHLHTIQIHNNERFFRKSFKPETIPVTLRKLSLHNNNLRGHLDFTKFPASLTSLNLSENEFKTQKHPEPVDFTTLPEALEELSFNDCIYLDIKFPLVNLPMHLKKLDLHAVRASGSVQFSALPSGLQYLDFSSLNKTNNSFLDLSQCPANLRYLNLRGTKFKGIGFTWYTLPPLLEYCNLASCGISTTDAGTLDLGRLPCADTLKVFDVNSNPQVRGTLIISVSDEDELTRKDDDHDIYGKGTTDSVGTAKKRSKLPNLVKLSVAGCGFNAIEATGKFPPKLHTFLVYGNDKLQNRQIFDFSLLNEGLKTFKAHKCKFEGSPDFTALPSSLRFIDLRENSLSTPSKDVPLNLKNLPRHLREFDLSRNKYDDCGVLIDNLTSSLTTFNLRKNKFNLKNSNLNTDGATKLRQIHIDGLDWEDEKHQKGRKRYLNDMRDSSDDDDDGAYTSDDDEASSDYSYGDEPDYDDDRDDSMCLGGDGRYYGRDLEGCDLDSQVDNQSGFGGDWAGEDQGYGYDETTDDSDRDEGWTDDTDDDDTDFDDDDDDSDTDWSQGLFGDNDDDDDDSDSDDW